MKKFLIFLILLAAFIFIFVKSNTLEKRHVTRRETEAGMEVGDSYSTQYVFHWDRFVQYIKDLPEKIRR